MIRVLVVEDSPVAREFLAYVLTSDPSIKVTGFAANGADAVEAVRDQKPDVITMDIHMPVMDGFEATRHIMETTPTPIVIVSGSVGTGEVASTFRALESGALAVVRRPPGLNRAQFEEDARELIRTVKLMSEVKVVKRFSRRVASDPFPPSTATGPARPADIRAVVIGASTGGPPVLLKILSGLPGDLPFPVLIVQHIAAGFVGGMVDWLAKASRFPVRLAVHGEAALPGFAYVAPDDMHMGLECGPRIALSGLPAESGVRPSVAHLFRSTAQTLGSGAVGVLLTGMGRDGAQELKILRDVGAITIAQDEASSVVHGMPGEAIKLGAAMHVLSPDGILQMLTSVARQKQERRG